MNTELFRRLLKHGGFGEEDAAILAEIHPFVAPSFGDIAEDFYQHQLQDEATQRIFRDIEQVNRLKASMVCWLHDLFLKPRDDVYLARRMSIGVMHVRVGLLPEYVFTAMARLRGGIETRLVDIGGISLDQRVRFRSALGKSMDLELAIISGAFHEAEKYRDMVDIAPEMIHGVDREGRFVFINRTEEQRLGRSRSEILGTKLEDIVVPEDRAILREHLKRVFAMGESSCEVRMLAGNGEVLHAEILAVGKRDNLTREITVSRAYVRDITERRRVERELRENQSLARLGAMAAVVAHEVRNPLAGISGAVQIIGEALPPDAPERAVVREIVERVAALNETVSDMLLYARPRLPHPVPLALGPLVHETVSLLRGDKRFQTAKLVIEGDDLLCLGDAGLLKPVILNLLVNAAQAAPEGKIRVRVSKAGHFAKLSVTDTGPGIPEAVREKVFEPFFTTKHQGSGLGLSIALRLVEAHHGHIALDCPATGGTTVSISLPLAGE